MQNAQSGQLAAWISPEYNTKGPTSSLTVDHSLLLQFMLLKDRQNKKMENLYKQL
jgi:hypothetical protein